AINRQNSLNTATVAGGAAAVVAQTWHDEDDPYYNPNAAKRAVYSQEDSEEDAGVYDEEVQMPPVKPAPYRPIKPGSKANPYQESEGYEEKEPPQRAP